MTNKDFYAFCRDQRKVEADEHKKLALTDMYQFMFECGISINGVTGLIRARVDQHNHKGQIAQSQAYEWLLGVFNGKH